MDMGDLSTPYFGTKPCKCPFFEYKTMKMFHLLILSTPTLRQTWFVHSMFKYIPAFLNYYKHYNRIFYVKCTNDFRLPMSRGTSKDRMCSFDEKVFEVVCQFATSFLQKSEEEEETKEKSKLGVNCTFLSKFATLALCKNFSALSYFSFYHNGIFIVAGVNIFPKIWR